MPLPIVFMRARTIWLHLPVPALIGNAIPCTPSPSPPSTRGSELVVLSGREAHRTASGKQQPIPIPAPPPCPVPLRLPHFLTAVSDLRNQRQGHS